MMQSQARKTATRLADLLVVVGPSGVGKSTLIHRLMDEFPNNFGYSVSHTTRGMRKGEVDGESYHFIAPEKMKELLAQDEFLEHATVHNTMYGTSQTSVRRVVVDQNRVCMMDLDIVGAQALHKHPNFNAVVVFVIPPSMEALESRLRLRGTETEEKIQVRLSNAVKELEWFEGNKKFFDFFLINESLDECYETFRDGVIARTWEFKTHSR